MRSRVSKSCHDEWLVEGGLDLTPSNFSRLNVAHSGEHHGELIPTQPRKNIAHGYGSAQAGSDGFEQHIPDGVPQ